MLRVFVLSFCFFFVFYVCVRSGVCAVNHIGHCIIMYICVLLFVYFSFSFFLLNERDHCTTWTNLFFFFLAVQWSTEKRNLSIFLGYVRGFVLSVLLAGGGALCDDIFFISALNLCLCSFSPFSVSFFLTCSLTRLLSYVLRYLALVLASISFFFRNMT